MRRGRHEVHQVHLSPQSPYPQWFMPVNLAWAKVHPEWPGLEIAVKKTYEFVIEACTRGHLVELQSSELLDDVQARFSGGNESHVILVALRPFPATHPLPAAGSLVVGTRLRSWRKLERICRPKANETGSAYWTSRRSSPPDRLLFTSCPSRPPGASRR
jgi:hypothetical protein